MEEISRKILEKRGLLPPTGTPADNGQVEETPAAAETESGSKGSRRRTAAASE
jgi:hypothetical protein